MKNSSSQSVQKNAAKVKQSQTIAGILTGGKQEYLSYDFQARLARRNGRPFDLAVAERNLLTLKSVFDRHGITFWLVYGTCLGAVRDGGFIPHDTDTDLAVFEQDKGKIIGALPDLIEAGLRPIRTKQPDDLLTFMRDDEYIDIGIFGKHRDQENFEYWSYQNNRVYGDHYDKFDQITFLNQTFLIPQRVEAYLTTLYGVGWKSPVRNLPAKEPKNHRDYKAFSNLLDLAEFFRDMPAHVVLKLSEHFPSYHDYSDIDILCADSAAVLAHLERVGQAYQLRGFTLKLEQSEEHLHLDFYPPGANRLNFRFDLLSSLDVYKKLSVTRDFVPAILANRIKTMQHGAEVCVPTLTHDLALRFLEFVEWKDLRPDKVKHWEFIEKTGNLAFVDVVNRYTDLKIVPTREGASTNLSWSRQPKPASDNKNGPAAPPSDDFQPLHQAGLDYAARRFADAAEHYCAALTINPNDVSVLRSLGECLDELHDVASAQWCLVRAADLESSSSAAPGAQRQPAAPADNLPLSDLLNSTLVFCNDCINRQDFSIAWETLGRALRLAPNNPELWVFRGRLALVLDAEVNAQQDFAEALRLAPRCAAAYAGVARLFFRSKKLSEAAKAAEQALSLDSTDEEANQVKAECEAARATPRAGSISSYYQVPANSLLPELGTVYDHFFSQRTNGTFVECGQPNGEGNAFTQGLGSAGWKGCRIGLSDCKELAGDANLLRPFLLRHKVEPGFEVLSVAHDGDACSLLSSLDLNFWRPQLVIVGRSADAVPVATDGDSELFAASYFQAHQYLLVYQNGGYAVYAAREKLLARRSRMDCFLIWGHGTQHQEDILNRLRARLALEIVAIHRRPVGDMTKFVQDLYACDTVPFEHLRAKTRYLLKIPAEVIFILVRNHNAQEKYYGEGAFRHIQCALVKDLKEEVRNAWNPRINGKRSEDHVIHATDYDRQVVHTLKVLELPTLEHYLRQPNRDYDLPYHLGPITACREVELPLEQIHARILGLGIIPIEQTPQFRFVAGEREPYLHYYARHFGKELNDDHSAAAFDRLIKEFDYGRPGRNGKPGLLVVSRQQDGYILHDGVHRAAILKHRGVAKVRVVEILAAENAPEKRPTLPAKSDGPVVVRLMGGLGNQMFQYAAGLALARKNQVLLKLDLTFLLDRTPRANFTPRNYELDAFPLHPGCEFIREVGALPTNLKRIEEKYFHFDPAVAAQAAGIFLEGYWQSPRYFDKIVTEVREAFRLNPELDDTVRALMAQIEAADAAVCLHVRRGDMVHDSHTASVHGSCSLEYYRTACDEIVRKIPYAHFFVFSDDPRWCLSQDLTRGRPCTVVSRPGTAEAPQVDLFLMQRCKHFITANSTFSWWAAYLGAAAEKMVIVPDPWFTTPVRDISDLFPQDWIHLSRNPGPVLKDFASDPVVSVVVPCYKQAHYLAEAVESVVGQSFSDWELIVVNDGSPDDTSQVARGLIARHPERRIRLLEKANGGLSDARNAGIKEARGKYILPLDSDDKLHPQMLQKTVALLQANPRIAIAYTDLVHFGVANKIVQAVEYDPARLPLQNQLSYCSLFRREAWSVTGGYNCNMIWSYEDWDFWVGCSEKGFVAKRLPEALFYYRVKQTSMYTKAVEHHRDNVARIVLNHPSLYNEASRREAEKILAEIQSAPAPVAPPKIPTVSVIMPCYNQASYLVEAVESVIAQTYTNWEIIIINDGSPDNTSEVAQSLILGNPAHKIRLIEKPNGGASDARNAGIRFAQGDYILPLDGDDKIAPQFLARTVALLEQRPEIGIAYTDWMYFGAHNGRRNAIDYDFARLCTKENLFTCTALYRKKAWETTGGYNPNMTRGVEDWEFWISCGEQGFKGQRIPEPLFFYRAKYGGRNQAVLPDLPVMFARIILNHPKLYQAEDVQAARKRFEAAGLPSPKPISLGQEWLPPEKNSLAFQQIIADAENCVRENRIEEAITQVERALGFAPTAECAARANEILESLRAALSVASSANRDTGSDEIFADDEVQAFEQLASAYSCNPADTVVAGQLQSLRQGLMAFLVTAQVPKLESQFKGGFGRVFRAIVKSGLASEVPTAEAEGQLAVLDEALVASAEEAQSLDYRPLLARMLRAPAHRGGSVLIALNQIPAWFLDDYLGYVFNAPQVFITAGEAELYHAHLLAWARAIQKLTRHAPEAPLARQVATYFALKVNCIPLYSSCANTKEFAQLRAAILEFVLVRNGALVDAKLPKRPQGRHRIRVGFVCAHFGAQTETHVTLPALYLDRDKFEICLFPVSSNPGPVEAYCRTFAATFTPLPKELDRQVKLIRDAALDVAIIGSNITAVTNQVALIAAHRLAPIQLASYCSPASTGMRHVDGFLTGTHMDTPGLQEHFSEKLWFTEGPPGCLDYTVENKVSGTRFTRESLGLAAGEVVFINAAACFKILPEMQETWARILHAVPNSRLLLLPFNPNWANAFPIKQFERTLAEACARHGVARDRFILVGSLPSRADVKALEQLADVYLDTYPFSGSISVIDPLELGLPVVGWEGTTSRSRAAAALLREIDLPELITRDERAYIALAARLGTDPRYKQQLKDRILAAMTQKPVFINPEAYAQGLGELIESAVAGRGRPVRGLALA